MPPPPRALTRDEFSTAIAELKTDLRDDLRAITVHLADLNGRTRKGEVADAEVRGQIAVIEARLAASRGAAMAPDAPASVHALSPKAQAALVGSAVLLLTVIFKIAGVIASTVGQKALELALRK
jgi:hypothetical protein